jgi:hypothetical protein
VTKAAEYVPVRKAGLRNARDQFEIIIDRAAERCTIIAALRRT